MKKALPSVRGSLIPMANPYFATDSLQLLDSLDSGILSDGGKSKMSYRGVCDTMKFVQNSEKDKLDVMSEIGSMAMSSSSQPRISSVISSDGDPFYSTIYGVPMKMEKISQSQDEEKYPAVSQIGVPGCPGAKDLEEALKRITPGEILSRRAMLSYAPAGTYSYDEQQIRTPESMFSALSAGTTTNWKMPKKLEIVKPMEGSQTLDVWSRLAKPTLNGLLHDNERIKVRGERPLDDLGFHVQSYSISDLEGKFFHILHNKLSLRYFSASLFRRRRSSRKAV